MTEQGEVIERNIVEWILIIGGIILLAMLTIFFVSWLLCKIGVTC